MTNTISNQILATLRRRGPLTRGTIKRIIGPPDNRMVTALLNQLVASGKLRFADRRYSVPPARQVPPMPVHISRNPVLQAQFRELAQEHRLAMKAQKTRRPGPA